MLPAITCFLIDDDMDDQEIFKLALEEVDKSILCITANSGIDALQKLKAGNAFIPDFIFLDLNMPRLNGKQTLKQIKANPALHRVPVIIYSSSALPFDVSETRDLG